MKKIILNEKQEMTLIKEFMQQGFSFEYFNNIENLSEKRAYCEKYLGEYLGQGSSRVVYEIGDGEVLKLALSSNRRIGEMQNSIEYTNYCYTRDKFPELNGLFPKVFQVADDRTWITCERVLPCTKDDFKIILGVPYQNGESINNKEFSNYETETYEDEFDLDLSVCEFIDWVENNAIGCDEDADRAYKQLLKSNKWFQMIYKYIKKVGRNTDLMIENFGITLRNNKPFIVILDSGYDRLVHEVNYI